MLDDAEIWKLFNSRIPQPAQAPLVQLSAICEVLLDIRRELITLNKTKPTASDCVESTLRNKQTADCLNTKNP